MREVFFIPEGHDINDYKDQWQGKFQEIHTGLSTNNKKYVLTPDKAHPFRIPEFQVTHTPENCSDTDYLIYRLVDDYGEFEDDPSYTMEVWSRDYDNPKAEKKKVDTHILGYNKKFQLYESEHVRLNTGWYLLIFMKNNEMFDVKELAVFENQEEE